MSRNPKNTIHITNIIEDRYKVWQMLSSLPGFKRISFHQDFCFVSFDHLPQASHAIEYVEKKVLYVYNTKTNMIASYAKHGLTPCMNSLVSTPPNHILYIGLASYFSEMNMLDLLKEFTGFEGCKFHFNYALAKFTSIENATKCLEELTSKSNLSVSFSKIKLAGDATVESLNSDSFSRVPSSLTAPKKTIHVTNLDRDRSVFLKMLLSLDGFDRVAFYNDYSFVCFDEIQNAALAMEKIMTKTKMKASFAKVDFIHHSVAQSQIGIINSILKISDFPNNMIHAELIGIFQTLEGFVNATHFLFSSCLVHFSSPELAQKALERINHFTNLTAVFSTKGLTDTKRVKLLKSPLDLPALCPLPVKPRSRSESVSFDGDHIAADSISDIKNPKYSVLDPIIQSNAGEQSKFSNLFSQPDYNGKSLSEIQGNPAQASTSSLNSTNTDVTFRESLDLLQETSPSLTLLSQDKSFQVSPPPEPVYSFEKYSYQDLHRQASDAKNLLNCLLNRVQFLEQENSFLKESLRRATANSDPDFTFSRSASMGTSIGFPVEQVNWDFQNPSLLHEKSHGQSISMLQGLLAMCD